MQWMMEMFIPFLTIPYCIAKDKSLQNKVQQEVKDIIKNKKDHNIANKIENILDADAEILHV